MSKLITPIDAVLENPILHGVARGLTELFPVSDSISAAEIPDLSSSSTAFDAENDTGTDENGSV